MNQDIPKANKMRKFQIAVVVSLIVGFPLISILVNIKGAQNGKVFYSNIKNNLGQLPDFSVVGWNNDTITTAGLRGNVTVVSFTSSESRDEVMNTLKPIVKTEQFREEVDNLQFLTFDLSNDSVFHRNYLQNLNARDRELWHILRGGGNLPNQLKLSDNFTVTLIDTAGVIRRFYDIRKPADRKMLVEHLAIMPIKRKKNVEKKDQKNF